MPVHGTGPISVYIHIPFCSSKCPYCDFKSVTGDIPGKRYTRAVIKELAFYSDLKSRGLASVYFGGGTPSLFEGAEIGAMIDAVKAAFAQSDTEVTLEANPGTVDIDRMKDFRAVGVNRISLGVQSFSAASLKTLGRAHGPKEAIGAFHLSKEAGFANIGIDLIYAIPGQTLEDWQADLEAAVGLSPEHISLYGLTIEEGTPFHNIYKEGPSQKKLPSKKLPPKKLPDDDEELAMYRAAIDTLSGAGYVHYEISNFGRPGFSSIHNQGYWTGRDYLGLGSSAHSYSSSGGKGWGRRWWNVPWPEEYMKRIEAGALAQSGSEDLGLGEAMTEALMLGLRMLGAGVDIKGFQERFGATPMEARPGLYRLEEEGLVEKKGDRLVLTPRGVVLSNEVFLRLLP